jgi:outer membrane protein assembly factor BamA
LAILAVVVATAPASAAADRWWGGGGIGLGFGGDVDYVSVEPVIGYRATERLSVGGRLVLSYRHDDRFAESYSATDYGAAVFTRYSITKHVFAQAEYEYLSYEYQLFAGGTDRDEYGSLFGGAGLSQPIGRRSSLFILGLYNFSYDDDERSPYNEPWVLRVGVGFSF